MGLSRWRLRSVARRAEQGGTLIVCGACSERFVLHPHTLFAYVVAGWGGDPTPEDPTVQRLESHRCGFENLLMVDEAGRTTLLEQAGIPPGITPESPITPD